MGAGRGPGWRPLLLYRADRGQWRAVWPLAVCLVHQTPDAWRGIEWTADTTIQAWAAVARELVQADGERETCPERPPEGPRRRERGADGPKVLRHAGDACARGVRSASTKERTA